MLCASTSLFHLLLLLVINCLIALNGLSYNTWDNSWIKAVYWWIPFTGGFDITILYLPLNGGVSSSPRAIFAGGTDGGDPNSNNIIDYVTIATLGDATDFGDMAVGGPGRQAGASNSIRGCFGGG